MKLSELCKLLEDGRIDSFSLPKTVLYIKPENKVENIEIERITAVKNKTLYNGRNAVLTYRINKGWSASTVEDTGRVTRWVTRKIDIDSDWIVNYRFNEIIASDK